MDNQIINCRCGRERRNKESNWSGLTPKISFSTLLKSVHKSASTMPSCN